MGRPWRFLADLDSGVGGEFGRRKDQVERRRPLADAPGGAVDRAGVRLSIRGQALTAAPTPPIAAAVRIRKSRRVSPSWPGITCDCVRSAIGEPRRSNAVPPDGERRERYTVEVAELCDRLPHKSAAATE